MWWITFTSVFVPVLLAELADKTQLVTFALVADTGQPKQVYLGVLGGLFCVTALGAVAGLLIGVILPLGLVRLIAGFVFLVLGVYVILTARRSHKEETSGSFTAAKYVWVRAFVLLFLAELGDKTQLVVILNAASTGLFWIVVLAGFMALALVNGVGVIVGDRARQFLSSTNIVYIAGVAFILAGLLVLLGII